MVIYQLSIAQSFLLDGLLVGSDGKRGGRGPTFCILNTGYQIGFGEGGDGSVGAAPGLEMGELDDEGCRDDFVVFTALLHLFGLHRLGFWVFF